MNEALRIIPATPGKALVYSYILAALLCLAIFLPYFHEPLYTETYVELSLEADQGFSFVKSFSGFRMGHWLPLSRLLMHLQYLWFGLDAFGYKVVMFLFHAVIACLVIYFTKELTRRIDIAAAAGFIFAVHFCHWEIVVHTNMLHYFVMMIFYMITLILFIRYLRSRSTTWLVGTYGSFLLCLLSSQTGVSLVAVMIVLELTISGKILKPIKNYRVVLKYGPLLLMTAGHLVISFLLNSDAGSPHNPFHSNSVYTFSAPLLTNLVTYILELSIPVIGSHVPDGLRWTLTIIITVATGGIVLMGSRVAKFCVFWIFAAQFMFLFWIWPYPNSRYTYLSSIPFSILIPVVFFQLYHYVKKRRPNAQGYRIVVIAVILCLIGINYLGYFVTARVRDFNIRGRNHLQFLSSFQNAVPSISDGSTIYITGIPPGSGRLYGFWASEAILQRVLSLYYKRSFSVKFVSFEEMVHLDRERMDDQRDILLRFENLCFHKISGE